MKKIIIYDDYNNPKGIRRTTDMDNGMDRVIQVGNIVDDSHIHFKNPQRGRVYSIEGIAPTMQNWSGWGGLQPKIVVKDERKSKDNGSMRMSAHPSDRN